MQFNIITGSPEKSNATYPEKPTANATILFLTANPADTQLIKINKEFNGIQEELEAAKQQMRLRLRLDVGRKELMEIFLRDQPNILHFSGHGLGEKGLLMQNEVGNSELLSTESLAALMDEFSDTLQCVLLNACYSVEQAKALTRYIPFVIGVDNAIGDAKAIAFSRAFYTCLFLGEGYESAFRKAVIQIDIEALGAGAQPVLYRWAPAATQMPESNSFQSSLEAAEIKGYNILIPELYPYFQMLLPNTHQIVQDSPECFESKDDSSAVYIEILDETISESDALTAVFKAKKMKWLSEGDEAEDEEDVNGLYFKWIRAYWPQKADYTSYVCAFRGADLRVVVAIISFANDNKKAQAIADKLFYSFEAL